MSDWKNITHGPWEFTEQGAKFGYINNPRWVETRTDKHLPCGHWHKRPIDAPRPEPIIPEPLFLGNSSETSGTGLYDIVIKYSTDPLIFETYYGGKGTGDDNLWCEEGLAVDDLYVYIADFENDRIMIRSKEDLSYIQQWGADGTPGQSGPYHPKGIAVDSDYLYEAWSGSNIIKRSKNNPTNIIYELDIDNELDSRVSVRFPQDVATDANNLYIADTENHRVLVINKETQSFVTSYGRGAVSIISPIGIDTDGSHVYIANRGANRVEKLEYPTSWSSVAWAGMEDGGLNPGNGDGEFNFLHDVSVNTSYVYVADMLNNRIQKLNKSDLSYLSKSGQPIPDWHTPWLVGELYQPTGVVTEFDDSFIYVCDQGSNMISKFDGDFNFIAWSGDPTGATTTGNNAYDHPSNLDIDSTYLYILDVFNARVVKRLKSTLAYVSEYADPGYINFSDIQRLTIDNTYIYVSDSFNMIHRINKTTMIYVDALTGFDTPQGMVVNGNDLIISEWTYPVNQIQQWDLTNIAGGVQSYTSTGAEVGSLVINEPRSIDVDKDYVYVVTIRSRFINPGEEGYAEGKLIKINKLTGDIIAEQTKFSYNDLEEDLNEAWGVTVDSDYVYVSHLRRYFEGTEALIIYNKLDLSFVASYVDGVEGTYNAPWGIDIYNTFIGDGFGTSDEPTTGDTRIDDEPMVWTLPK